METQQTSFRAEIQTGSYRTYEEWKLGSLGQVVMSFTGSYRTYEEWKRGCDISNWSWSSLGSYRTYEEWKHV